MQAERDAERRGEAQVCAPRPRTRGRQIAHSTTAAKPSRRNAAPAGPDLVEQRDGERGAHLQRAGRGEHHADGGGAPATAAPGVASRAVQPSRYTPNRSLTPRLRRIEGRVRGFPRDPRRRVDPQPAVRAGLALLLRARARPGPRGAAAGAADAPDLLARERPAIVLLDPRLLDGDGIALCRRLKAEATAPRIVLYTARPGERARAARARRRRRRAGRQGGRPGRALRRDPARRARRHGAAAAHAARSSTPPRTASTPRTSRCSPMLVDRTPPTTSPRRCG